MQILASWPRAFMRTGMRFPAGSLLRRSRVLHATRPGSQAGHST